MSFSIQDVKSAVVNRGVLLKNFIDMLKLEKTKSFKGGFEERKS